MSKKKNLNMMRMTTEKRKVVKKRMSTKIKILRRAQRKRRRPPMSWTVRTKQEQKKHERKPKKPKKQCKKWLRNSKPQWLQVSKKSVKMSVIRTLKSSVYNKRLKMWKLKEKMILLMQLPQMKEEAVAKLVLPRKHLTIQWENVWMI